MARHPGRMRSITADNGTEFHWYGEVEAVNPVKFYFATPHHSWERGTNENTNGLLRQYLPKGQSRISLTQAQCDAIAHHQVEPRACRALLVEESVEHEAEEGEPMKTGEGWRETFVVAT